MSLPEIHDNFTPRHSLYGWLQPRRALQKDGSWTIISSKEKPTFVKITKIDEYCLDRSRSYRGHWIAAQGVLYWLQEPHDSQKLLHLHFRAQLAVLSNLLDLVFTEKNGAAYAKMTVSQVHQALPGAFDKDLLAYYALDIHAHLIEARCSLQDTCKFLKSIASMKKPRIRAALLRPQAIIQLAEEAEKRSKQYSWGEFIGGNGVANLVGTRSDVATADNVTMLAESPHKPSTIRSFGHDNLSETDDQQTELGDDAETSEKSADTGKRQARKINGICSSTSQSGHVRRRPHPCLASKAGEYLIHGQEQKKKKKGSISDLKKEVQEAKKEKYRGGNHENESEQCKKQAKSNIPQNALVIELQDSNSEGNPGDTTMDKRIKYAQNSSASKPIAVIDLQDSDDGEDEQTSLRSPVRRQLKRKSSSPETTANPQTASKKTKPNISPETECSEMNSDQFVYSEAAMKKAVVGFVERQMRSSRRIISMISKQFL